MQPIQGEAPVQDVGGQYYPQADASGQGNWDYREKRQRSFSLNPMRRDEEVPFRMEETVMSAF